MSKKSRNYKRFHWTQCVAHALLFLSFFTLAITGLPQKYPLTGWAQFLVNLFGGIESTRLIHHTSATVLMLLTVYHILDIGYRIFVRHSRLSMLPSLKDVKDAWQAFMHNLGFAKSRPQMGRYTFEEKMEYWSLVWGTIIMGITGYMMWNPLATVRFLPGEFIPAAKAAHGGEALLAVMAIIVWHMYGVHLRRFNKSIWTGYLTEEEMLHEHAIELADIKAGIADRPTNPKALRKRQMVYYPIAGFLAMVMLLGVYGFVNGEQTAITTIPFQPSPIPIYVPQTPTPLPTVTQATLSKPTAALTWESYVGPLLQQKCAACHGPAAMAGLSFTTFADAMRGSNNGPVIVPGDITNSRLIVLQSAGGHYGQLSLEELDKVIEWIDQGPPER